MGGAEAETAPGLGDYDAVGWVAGVEADLDGEIDADVADEVGQGSDVLGALVGDAGDEVAVDENAGGGEWRVGADGSWPFGVGDAAVGDAAGEGEVVAAGVLDLFRSEALAGEVIARGSRSNGGCAEKREVARRPQKERQMSWNVLQHGYWPKHSLLRRLRD